MLLVGMMGSGKTTVGRALARRRGCLHLDSDEQVQAHTGLTVPEIFEARGEPAFRAEEARALAEAIDSVDPAVISVAGGAVLDPDNRRRMSGGGTVVWLRADPATLARRVGDGSGRPLLAEDPESVLRHLYDERRPLYEEVADVVIDVDTLTRDEVVEAVEKALQ